MSKIKQIQSLARNGLYYLTEHADDEAVAEAFDIYDVEHGILTGKVRRTWPRGGTYEVVGSRTIQNDKTRKDEFLGRRDL
ncbi:MAG: hypothetical protein HY327_14145 [Chloroflexi bacterium]|nr:hypothetical protein [Chloroflexota bacterium]